MNTCIRGLKSFVVYWIKYLYKNDGNNERRNDDATARVAGFADVVTKQR